MESLTDRCIKAIADENISELNKLIEICDSLHRGIPIEGYNIDSIPSDDLYMGMEDKIKEINGRMMATMMKQQVRTLKRTSLNTTTLGEMWMGSDAIIKSHSINSSMVGKKVMVLVNLKPATLAGVLSEGMLLCAEDAEGNLALMKPEKDMPAGAEIC